jgi:hypothetical protein
MNTLERNLLNINKDFYTSLLADNVKRLERLEKSCFNRQKSIKHTKRLIERYTNQLEFINNELNK